MMKFKSIIFLFLVSFGAWCQPSKIEPYYSDASFDELESIDIYFPREWQINEEIIRPRLKKLENIIPLIYHEEIHRYIELFAYNYSDFTQLMLERKNLYFPIFERILAEYQMPEELKYLTLIESGLDPKAKSRVGAAGLWQFMPNTATKGFGLNVNYEIDERFDPELSTRAACLYLKELYGRYKDWYLVLAAYNYGPGNVNRAIRRSGGERNYWKLYPFLPKQTRNYVPKFIAMDYLMNYNEDYFIFPIYESKFIQYDKIKLNHSFDLELFSNLTKTSIDTLKLINPSLKSTVFIPPSKDFELKIPTSTLDTFQYELPKILDSVKIHTNKVYLAKVKYQIKPGDSLSLIANRHGMTVSELKKMNNLNSNMIRAGKYLFVKRKLN